MKGSGTDLLPPQTGAGLPLMESPPAPGIGSDVVSVIASCVKDGLAASVVTPVECTDLPQDAFK